jgi:hypothetical protein
LLGYFFKKRFDEVPSLADTLGLTAADAITVSKFGDLNLIRGVWPVIGQRGDWDRADWPMPAFHRPDIFTGRRGVRVEYSEDDVATCISEVRASAGDEQLTRDGLLGAGAVEKVLTRLLDTEA